MPHVAPFRGLRYDPAVAGELSRLTTPPYDVISEPRRHREASPFNAVHVDLPEGVEDPNDPENRYARAGGLLSSWERSGALMRPDEPCYYAHEFAWSGSDGTATRLRGVFVALELEPWGGSVIPHEHTMPGPVEDRLRLLRATATHLSPIYGTVSGPCAPLAALLERTSRQPPAEELLDEEGVTHRLWEIPQTEPIETWLRDEDILIADGHHRYTTALAYRDERHAADGSGPWDAILALVIDAGTESVPVLPYHRVQVAGEALAPSRPATDLDDVLARVSDEGLVVGVITRSDGRGPDYGLLDLDGSPPVVRALHAERLDAAAPGDALRFTHDAADAERAVLTGEAIAAYVLPQTTPARVLAAIEHGDRLPRKSTFFWPKPRTGMLFMPVR
ncbi:MAG: DUF1015 family protein [Actinomycetota bacterium]|jgi:uncharacterized protein (DUF1015 family)